MDTHQHDNWTCPPHLDNCDCPNLQIWGCNQYYTPGACPDDIDAIRPKIPRDVIVVPPELAALFTKTAPGIYTFHEVGEPTPEEQS